MHKRIPIFLISINYNFMSNNLSGIKVADSGNTETDIQKLAQLCTTLNDVVLGQSPYPGVIIATIATEAVQRGVEYGIMVHRKMVSEILSGKPHSEINTDELFKLIHDSVNDVMKNFLK